MIFFSGLFLVSQRLGMDPNNRITGIRALHTIFLSIVELWQPEHKHSPSATDCGTLPLGGHFSVSPNKLKQHEKVSVQIESKVEIYKDFRMKSVMTVTPQCQ